MSIAKEEGRKLVRAYYVEFLNSFLPKIIDKNYLKINFEENPILKEIEKFKEKAEKEKVWIKFEISENKILINFIHSITHVSIKWKVYFHKILKDEIEDLRFSTEENILSLLNEDVLLIQNRLSNNFYYWKPSIYNNGELIKEGSIKTIYWIAGSISQLVWETFSDVELKVSYSSFNSSLIDNWLNYREDPNKGNLFSFVKEADENWRMNIKDHPDCYILIQKTKYS